MESVSKFIDNFSKRTQRLLILGVLLCFFLLIGISYSYYHIGTKLTNSTETKIETKKLGITYNGTGYLEVDNIIPGDSVVRTFQIQNTTDVGLKYNIYMENITNEFSDDLVYKITDDAGNIIVPQQPLPTTNDGKVYLKKDIVINVAPAVNKYILTIDYLYKPNESQDDYQGKIFLATLSVDSTSEY